MTRKVTCPRGIECASPDSRDRLLGSCSRQFRGVCGRHNGSASRVSVFQSVKAVHLIVMQMKLLSVSCVKRAVYHGSVVSRRSRRKFDGTIYDIMF